MPIQGAGSRERQSGTDGTGIFSVSEDPVAGENVAIVVAAHLPLKLREKAQEEESGMRGGVERLV